MRCDSRVRGESTRPIRYSTLTRWLEASPRLERFRARVAAKRRLRIAVVDSGVEPKLAPSTAWSVARGGWRQERPVDAAGHGSAIARRIRRRAPEAEFVSIRVLDSALRGTSEDLIAALRLARRLDADLVNLSLSTTRPDTLAPTLAAVLDLHGAGSLVLCAEGPLPHCYPTRFVETVGVGLALDGEWSIQEAVSDPIQVRVPLTEGRIASSYACAVVTGEIALRITASGEEK